MTYEMKMVNLCSCVRIALILTIFNNNVGDFKAAFSRSRSMGHRSGESELTQLAKPFAGVIAHFIKRKAERN